MNLNKRDLYAYKRFLNQIKIGFNDEMLDKYAKVIQNFIEEYYNSSDKYLFDLDDFIQEGLIIIDKCKKYEAKRTFNEGLLELRLKNKYRQMKKEKYHPKVDNNLSYEMDSSNLEFSILLPKLMKYLKTENQKIVIKELLKGTSTSDICKIINRSNAAVTQTKFKALRIIKNSLEFKEQYYDREDEIYTEYERFVLRCMKERSQDMFFWDKERLEDYWKDKIDYVPTLSYLGKFFSEIQNYCPEEEYEFFKNRIEEDINNLS